MMTHGWRRFVWEELLEEDNTDPKYLPEKGIRVEGKVSSYTNRNKGLESDLLLRFIEDPLFEVETTSLESGLFWFDKLSFTDTMGVYIKTLSDKKRKQNESSVRFNSWIRMHDPEIPSIRHEHHTPYQVADKDEALIDRGEELFDIAAAFDQRVIILDEVSITKRAYGIEADPFTRRKSMMIYGEPDHRIMLDSFPHNYSSLYEYLYTVPGVQVGAGVTKNVEETDEARTVSITYEFSSEDIVRIRGSQSFNSSEGPLYLLDGVVVSSDFVYELNMTDILYFDVLKGPSASVYGSRGAGGAIALYSRQG
ncbi:unnamed protein product, partial [Chrysoparadoxa australica]